ncbi:SDR family NAD(P)-dependent oxidoreductase [Moorella sulfitireducens]|uniref:SDR family NAD(P)-dependent oxidoreductase n=1 Tax=Neomoorella sulfitireducens TaxID=2972948 RepID=UPI0021ABF142|nr:glucose 1-dehydrogenase [Moorella sulfitireducens]
MGAMFDLSQRVAVVTGGAGGIGSAIARGLAAQGAKVVITSRNIESLKKTAEEIATELDAEILPLVADVTNEASVAALVQQVVKQLGTVDILVNAHGFNVKAMALDFPINEWQRLFDANVKGTMITCKEFGRVMVEKRYGKIVNVSSVRGVRANAGGNSGYCATKAAVDMITRCLAAEWAPYKVNVNAVGPALIATKFTEKQMQEPGRTEKYLRNIPWGRLGLANDVVGAVVFLASDAAEFVTGQIIYVDGGLTAIG